MLLLALAGCTPTTAFTNPSVTGVLAPSWAAPVILAQAGGCSSWQVVFSPNRNPYAYSTFLRKVGVVSDVDAWAVGTFYENNREGGGAGALILHWDGSGWRIVSNPAPQVGSDLYDLAAVSSSDVWAVGDSFDANGGDQGLIEHWDGTAWSIVPAADPGTEFWHFEGVVAAGPDDVWAVGNTATGHSGGTLTEHWDGRTWSIVPSPSPNPRPLIGEPHLLLDAVTAISPQDVWAVGEAANVAARGQPSNTLIEHWDGSTWRVVPSPDVTNDKGEAFDQLLSVAANSASDVWTVGDHGNGHVLVEHWDGTSWRIVAAPHAGAPEGFTGVATSAGGTWAVGVHESGGTQRALIERWDGTAWSIVENPTGPNTALAGVAVGPSGNAWAVGSSTPGQGEQTLTLQCQ